MIGMPKRGEERNRQLVTEYGEPQTLISGGKVIYHGPLHAKQYTQSERFCKSCNEWVVCKGIIEAIACPQCKTMW